MAKARILLVNDRPEKVDLLSQALENSEYALVGMTASLAEAMRHIETMKPDLVLIDTSAQESANPTLAAAQIEDIFGIPVIAFASNELISKRKCTCAADSAKCTKYPFIMDELDARISAALRKQETRQPVKHTRLSLAETLTSPEDAMITVDAKGRVMTMNPAAEKMTGWKESEVMGKLLEEMTTILDLNTCEPQSHPVAKALRESGTGDTTTCCSMLSARYPTIVPIYQSATPMRNGRGEITSVVWVFRNVLDHRKAETRIAHRLAMEEAVTRVSRRLMSPEEINLSVILEILAEASRVNSAAIFRFDNDPLQATPVCSWKDDSAVTGGNEEQTFNMKFYPWWMRRLENGEDVLISDASALPEAAQAQKMLLQDRGVRSLLSVPIHSTEGALQGFMCFAKTLNTWEGILEDARLLRLAAETLGTYWTYRQLRTALRESDKLAATGRMVARIAHEINNPLAGILHAFLLVKDGIPATHPHHDYIPLIEGEIERLANIVREMMQLHAPRDGTPKLLSISQSLNDVAILSKTYAEKRNITIRVEDCDDIGFVTLPEDALRQVLINLIRNAIEASPENSEVILRAVAHRDRIKISVIDQGPGIPDKIRKSIFEPFFTTKKGKKDSGLGLGLSISQGVAGFMRGSLYVRSKPGQGAEFCLDVPIRTTKGNKSHGC